MEGSTSNFEERLERARSSSAVELEAWLNEAAPEPPAIDEASATAFVDKLEECIFYDIKGDHTVAEFSCTVATRAATSYHFTFALVQANGTRWGSAVMDWAGAMYKMLHNVPGKRKWLVPLLATRLIEVSTKLAALWNKRNPAYPAEVRSTAHVIGFTISLTKK